MKTNYTTPPERNDPSCFDLQINVRGALRWSDEMLEDLFTEDDGSPLKASAIRKWLRMQLANGNTFIQASHKVIPAHCK